MVGAMRGRRWRVIVLTLAAVYFLLPLLAAAEFSLRAPGGGYGLANWVAIARDPVLITALLTSLQIAVVTAVLVLALVVPTVVWVRLRLPGLAGALESATILPIVIPPVVMAAGIAFVQANLGGPVFRALFASSTTALTPFYVVLALAAVYFLLPLLAAAEFSLRAPGGGYGLANCVAITAICREVSNAAISTGSPAIAVQFASPYPPPGARRLNSAAASRGSRK